MTVTDRLNDAAQSDIASALGLRADALTPEQRDELDSRGYTVLPGVISVEQIEILRETVREIGNAEGRMSGHEYTLCDDGAFRLHNLLEKSPAFDEIVFDTKILSAISYVLGPDFRLSMFNYRAQLPGQKRQKLHVDWYEGAAADRQFKVCNAIITIDDFTIENGATRVVPGSHVFAEVPKDLEIDRYDPYPGEERVCARAGDVIVFNSHLWHGGMDNVASTSRGGFNAFFCRADQTPEMDQGALLSDSTKARFSAAQRQLLSV